MHDNDESDCLECMITHLHDDDDRDGVSWRDIANHEGFKRDIALLPTPTRKVVKHAIAMLLRLSLSPPASGDEHGSEDGSVAGEGSVVGDL